MPPPNRFTYQFHSVGQGLFSSGWIHHDAESSTRFLWVYDCGSLSGRRIMEREVRLLQDQCSARRRIDLLVLSHFDHDHISGVCRLIQNFEIGTLMLPYMPLARRMIIAFQEGSGDAQHPYNGFYRNPVDFLLNQGGPGIENILFVPPSGEDGPPSDSSSRPPDFEGGTRPQLDYESDKPKDTEAQILLLAAQ